jgi:hypothetical protein
MKPPVVQRFQKQNYPGSPDWFTRFLSDINQFTEITWNILNKNITPGDNLDAQVFQTSILAGPAPEDNAFQFELKMNHTPTVCILAQVIDQAAYEGPLAAATSVQWVIDGTTVSITGVAGLLDTHTYNLTLLLL